VRGRDFVGHPERHDAVAWAFRAQDFHRAACPGIDLGFGDREQLAAKQPFRVAVNDLGAKLIYQFRPAEDLNCRDPQVCIGLFKRNLGRQTGGGFRSIRTGCWCRANDTGTSHRATDGTAPFRNAVGFGRQRAECLENH